MNPYEDEQYLRLLSIFHYIVGGLVGLIACFPLIHFTLGVGMIVASLSHAGDSDPMMILPGLLFAGVAGVIILVGWTLAICIALTGYFLSARKNYMFCLVMAGVETIFTPFGTVLGVFTIILLIRPSVKVLFGRIAAV
jgi:hypothetical protein